MLSTFGATQEQADRFISLYKQAPLRAAAEEAGLNIIQATMIARHAGCLRITEAAIINSTSGEIGRMGERIFQKHLPEAVNTNLSIRHNNPCFDFILNGAKIDIKTSTGSKGSRGTEDKYRMKCSNKFETDIFVVIVKEDDNAALNDEDAYRHCFIIPSLFLVNHEKIEINKAVLRGAKMAWSEYLFPIEALRENLLMLTANPQLLAIPPELREAAKLNRDLKKETRHAKRNRKTAR
ncbi:hypothetical protein [Neisseria shayeganii]|uniref:Uncharacterized protein n=1 Tax=Neisseria shayeganii 871 TaxID=1032488 RepID=G4CJH5_9NEIS|nr:hypothetical protein [Neisseria shayeganii]EGY52026.1 hypothetical protein HMPREF9371_1765 [Neisseria shayeganii 871]